MERSHHLEGLFILVFLVLIAGLYLWQNSQPDLVVSVPAPTPTGGSATAEDWQAALEQQIASASTPLPTVDLTATAFVPPTLEPPDGDADVIYAPTQISGATLAASDDVTPTEPPPLPQLGPTETPAPTGVSSTSNSQIEDFQPPPEQAPLSVQSGDHFWLRRPVDASANSASLFYYPFGSNGAENQWRVHHGVDMPNPVGEQVHAGLAGRIIWAGDWTQVFAGSAVEIYPSYGNTVVIEHDYGYRGQKLWSLYAHLSAVLVEVGDRVEAGDPIGLVGATGDVSGPHVHLEVRVGQNTYYTVQNPLLWIVPYVGTGIIAGQVFYADGTYADDAAITLSQEGRVKETTSTYISPYVEDARTWDVVPDPYWKENFVLGDVPEGTYDITANINGLRISDRITVKAGTVNFIQLQVESAATPQPAGEDN
ncbi:M23 family metallopeptidase [Aggregatilinea lenta]|uniref:M23 family metallopeptidase n=1 Tax=Aggregatilinea lenta TaxID=913108 RepID=UPI0013C2FE12|nr:M23 family metallopeptidase [Aggregatilinea lenta]